MFAARSLLAFAFVTAAATLPALALSDEGADAAGLAEFEARWLPPDASHTYSALGIYDPVGDRVVAFGGQQNQPVNEARALSLSGTPYWTLIATENPPPPRYRHTVVYDSRAHRIVVFGGWVVPTGMMGSVRNDVWVLPLVGAPIWKELVPSGTGPSPTRDHAAVYDSFRRRMIVIDPQMRVWELTLGSAPRWQEIVVPGVVRPSPRSGHRAILDPNLDRLIVFGGGASDFAWELRFSPTPEWVPHAPPGALPPNRAHHNLVLDRARNRVLLYGGTFTRSDVWALPLAGDAPWTRVVASGANPANQINTWAIYDPRRDRLVVPDNDTDGRTNAFSLSLGDLVWTEHQTRDPGERWEFAMIHDSSRDRMILHSGTTGYPPTWSYDLSAGVWSPLAVEGHSPAIVGTVGIYDPVEDRAVFFGQGQVWALSFATARWSLLASEGAPPSDRAAAVYDPVRRRMLVVGGRDGSGLVRTVSAFSLETHQWTITEPGNAQPRGSPALIYDPVGDRLVLHGGTTDWYGTSASSDVYTLRLDGSSSWIRQSPIGTRPTARYEHAAVYDPIKRRMILFSGRRPVNPSQDPEVWELQVGLGFRWRYVPVAAALGQYPYGHRAVFDALRNRYVTYGGSLGTKTAVLQIERAMERVPIDIRPEDPDNRIEPGTLRSIPVGIFSTAAFDATTLDLATLRFAGAPVAIRGGNPVRILDLNQDGHDDAIVDFEPTLDLSPDATIAYVTGRTRTFQPFQGADGVRFGRRGTAQTETVGGADRETPLAIRAIMPNPARGPMGVAWSMSASAEIGIEVFDVSGRRVWARDLGGWKAGDHEVVVTPERTLPAGVYWLRLSAGSIHVKKRVALVD